MEGIMHRYMTQLLSVFMLLVFSAMSVHAEREVTVRAVDPAEIGLIVNGLVDPSSTCQVGNMNEPVWSVGNFLLPPEEYKLTFRTWGTCAVCNLGFRVTQIHVLLETTEACDVTIAMDVEQAEQVGPYCWGPGVEWCNTGLIDVTIENAGLWDISLPISCPCLSQRRYLLSLEFNNYSCATGSMPALVTDGSPMLCYNWNDIGTGWYDLYGQWPTWPGNLLFRAEASCCSPPVPIEQRTWGTIKSLYRQ
jgi:hypothetical protein